MQCMQQHHRNEPLPQALQWSGQLFSGLTFMHSQGIIHRDLKPNNILLAKNEHGCWDLKIADFGLSRKEAHLMTAAVVTLPYWAPEILFGALHEKAGLPKCLQQSSRNRLHSHLTCCVCNVDRACCMCLFQTSAGMQHTRRTSRHHTSLAYTHCAPGYQRQRVVQAQVHPLHHGS